MNNRQPTLFTVVLLLSFYMATGQEGIRDTLFGKNYEELNELFYTYLPEDTLTARNIVDAYLTKAHAEKDTVRIARGFHYYAAEFGPEMGLMYSDSVIELTRHIEDKEYPARGYMLRGYWFYYTDNYVESTENYLLANKYAVARNNLAQQLSIRPIMAALKHVAGKHREALVIEKEHLYALENDPEYKELYSNVPNREDGYQEDLMIAIYNLCQSYLQVREVDSSKIYIRRGVGESLGIGDTIQYYRFVSTGGVAEYYDGNYTSAIDSFVKAIPHLENRYTYTMARFYKGRSYEAMGQDKEALSSLKKADSMVVELDYWFPELRPAYEYMMNYYEAEQKRDSQLIYIDKLLKLDQELLNNKAIDGEITRKYDTPYLLRQKEKLISELEHKNSKSRVYKLLLLLVAALFALFLTYYYQRQRMYKKRYRKLLEGSPEKVPAGSRSNEDAVSGSGVPAETFRNIEEGLMRFEAEKRYTDPDITLYTLARELQTNSTYLSKVINTTRKMNFSKYLHKLRINDIIERLKQEERLRSYSIYGIAQEAGYNTAQSFASSFCRHTGIYPSYFVKKLKEERFAGKQTA